MGKSKKLVEPLRVAKSIRFLVCRACGFAILDGAICSPGCMFDTQTERPRVALGLATYTLKHVEAVTQESVKWTNNAKEENNNEEKNKETTQE
jgi:hypothetical protein